MVPSCFFFFFKLASALFALALDDASTTTPHSAPSAPSLPRPIPPSQRRDLSVDSWFFIIEIEAHFLIETHDPKNPCFERSLNLFKKKKKNKQSGTAPWLRLEAREKLQVVSARHARRHRSRGSQAAASEAMGM